MRNTGFLMAAAAAFATSVAGAAEGGAIFDGGWRLTVGAAYDSGVKSNLRFMPTPHYDSPLAGLPRKAPGADGSGVERKPDGSSVFPSGAWYNPNDPAYPGTPDDPGKTRYYGFPKASWNGDDTFTLGSSSFGEYSETVTDWRSLIRDCDCEAEMPGIVAELSRNLYHDAERGWGVDLALDFQYFRRNRVVECSSRYLEGSSTYRSGSSQAVADLSADGGASEWMLARMESMGYYGYGSYDDYVRDPYGGASPISLGDITMRPGPVSTLSHSSFGGFHARGDYENFEFILLARPYYDVFEWLRLNAMVGLVVSRQDLDFSMWRAGGNAVTGRTNRDFSQWDVYGIAGAGLMLYYRDFTLGCDFMARFLDREMDIDDQWVRGTVERGRWLFRVTVGYEF